MTRENRPALRRLYCGKDPARARTIEDLRATAQKRLPAFAFEYLEGGAEEEATLDRNLEAFEQWRFVPQTLVDISNRDLTTQLFGRRSQLPFAIAPTGLNGLFVTEADLRLAEAAAERGIAFVQSTMSNDPIEKIATVEGLRHWWQLYVFGPPSVGEALIAKALQCGCETLVVTTDTQVYGNREWDERNRVGGDFLTWPALIDAAMHPRWLASTPLRKGLPRFENVIKFLPEGERGFFDSAYWIRKNMDLALTWQSIEDIRRLWPRILILKGILSVDDVKRAVASGVDGVVLSNHGGRQLDWAVSPLDVLPSARSAAGDGFPILMDGGIRRGTDIAKALALGADAVLIGRAALYGVAAAGKAGVLRAIDILAEEFDRTLALLGASSIRELKPHLLTRRD